jgi:sugar phosphate isomerase/epimerase
VKQEGPHCEVRNPIPFRELGGCQVRPENLDEVRNEVIERLGLLVERAAQAGVTLLHENERDIYGESATGCHDLLATINSPTLRMAFDPANFVQAGVRPMEDAWPLFRDFTVHVHIKDAVFHDGSVRPAGQGDGDIPNITGSAKCPRLQGRPHP